MFADAFTKPVPVPGDPSHTVTIRKLSHFELVEAQDSNSQAAIKHIRDLGGTAAIREMAELSQKERTGEVQRDPFSGHDKRVLLKYGVKAWTYERPVTPENLALISDDVAPYLARQIFDFTKGRSEAEQKNG